MKQNGFFAQVIKTNIIRVDESSHSLPPHNGVYQEFKVADYYCPEEWSNDGIFIAVKEGDPLWFDFRSNDEECAILCAVQRINPVTGEPADLEKGLFKDPTQNYLRMPEQRWLDGYAKEGKVYQFVVTKAGIGLAVNEYVLPKHMQDSHAIGFAFFGLKNPKPKPFSDHHPLRSPVDTPYRTSGLWHNKVIIGTSPHQTNMWTCSSGGLQTASFAPKSGLNIDSGNIDSGNIDSGNIDSGNIDSGNIDSGEAQCLFAASVAETNELVSGASEDTVRFTRNRIADDNYVESVEEPSVIDTVDILAAQEANLTELDKASMGAGGRIVQEIVTDANTTDYYHEKRSALLTIYFALPEMYKAIMKKGKRQDVSKKDRYKTSGHIGGVAVPLVTQDIAQ